MQTFGVKNISTKTSCKYPPRKIWKVNSGQKAAQEVLLKDRANLTRLRHTFWKTLVRYFRNSYTQQRFMEKDILQSNMNLNSISTRISTKRPLVVWIYELSSLSCSIFRNAETRILKTFSGNFSRSFFENQHFSEEYS